MKLSNAGRITVVSAIALGGLMGCGSKPAPLPPTQVGASVSPDVYAVVGTDTISKGRFERACLQAGVSSQGNGSQTLEFWNEYVRYGLEGLAARDAGLTRDSLRLRRWASIRERILMDRYYELVLRQQYGFSDLSLDSLVARDSSLRSLPADSARSLAARRLVLAAANLDSVYKADQANFRRKDSTLPPLDSVRARVEDIALGQKVQALSNQLEPRLRKEYKVEVAKLERPAIPEDSLMALYRKNADQWSGLPVYHLSALASKDSSALAKALAKKRPASKEAFQALSARFPVGSPVVAPKGELGRVKRGYALPFGIGMATDLFPLLDSATSGHVVGPIRVDSVSYAFWLEGVDKAELRPFSQVASEVRAEYEHQHPWTPASAAVVASWDHGVLFTKADVDFIAEEIPPYMRRQFPPERVLDFMIRWKVVARAAAESGIMARPTLQATLRDNESVYWSQAWRQSREAVAFGFSDSALASVWKRWQPSLFHAGVEDTASGVNRDAARLAVMPDNYLQQQYDLRPEAWSRDSVLPKFDSLAPKIFRGSRSELDQLGRSRLDSLLKARYGFRSFASAPHAPVFASLREIYDSARAAYDRRELEKAEHLYRRIETEYLQGDSLFEKALFQMGQLQGEKQNYPASLEAYRKLLSLRPHSGEAYKAQFMIAFTFSEYLKQEKRAVSEYRKVLANYPNCELAKDADWMIRNIESGGALMPKFDDSLSAPDSSKAPAPKASTGSASAKATPASAPAKPAKAPANKPAAGAASPAKDGAKVR
jgi:hypothetical protein